METYDLSNIGEAAFWYLLEHEFEITYWNQNQKEFDQYSPYEKFADCIWRSYNWNEDEPNGPNFECLEVSFFWYKYPGRSMKCNVNYSGDQWSDWLERAMTLIENYDKESF